MGLARVLPGWGLAAALLAAGSAAQAQTTPPSTPCPSANPSVAFGTVSVRRVPANHEGITNVGPPNTDRFAAEYLSLRNLVAAAYGFNSLRVESRADWPDSTFYDVTATADRPLTEAELQPRLQQLLHERFHFQCHFETRQVPGFALVLARGGTRLQPGKPVEGNIMVYRGGLQGSAMSAKTLAALLEIPAGKPVVDKTGLSGLYNVELAFAPLDATDSTLPDFFSALQEQLGLKLEPQKVPVQVLVIDHADQDPTEN